MWLQQSLGDKEGICCLNYIYWKNMAKISPSNYSFQDVKKRLNEVEEKINTRTYASKIENKCHNRSIK